MRFYYRDNGEVVMMSDSEIQTKHECLVYKPKVAELKSINSGAALTVEDGKIIIEKTEEEQKTDFKAQIDNAETVDDLKTIINKLI